MEELVHRTIQEAEALLQAAGETVRIIRTAPPRGPIEGTERVVRVTREEDTVVLTTAFYPELH